MDAGYLAAPQARFTGQPQHEWCAGISGRQRGLRCVVGRGPRRTPPLTHLGQFVGEMIGTRLVR